MKSQSIVEFNKNVKLKASLIRNIHFDLGLCIYSCSLLLLIDSLMGPCSYKIKHNGYMRVNACVREMGPVLNEAGSVFQTTLYI